MMMIAAERVAMTLKSPNILIKNLHSLRNHHHHQIQIIKRTFPLFPSSFSTLINSSIHTPPVSHRPHLIHRSLRMMSSNVPPSDSSSSINTVRVNIKGRVQGVFYRDWTVQNATELGLKGWVRNRRDGSVEALFSGRAEKVAEMQERCRRGPPSALVTGLDVNPSTEDPGIGFERRPTA